MSSFIRKLPLQAKLMFIAAIPFLFLIFLTWQVYNEKNQKLQILQNYREFISASAEITALIDAMQQERKYSFDYAILKKMRPELLAQRPKTDALIQKLIENNDPSLRGFKHYTRIGELDEIRNKLDSASIGPNEVMHFYSNTVFRLNTLNTIPPANTAYLGPVFNDLMSQKLLSEMTTYFGIIRSNIYNVLHTQQYMVETLIGTVGTRDIYESYDTELQAKASPALLKAYNNIKQNTALKPTNDYIDKLFSTFKFEDTYTAAEWWKVSDEGDRELRQFQALIWERINTKLDQIYQRELDARNRTIIFLLFALITIFLVVTYILYIVSRTLRRLRIVAERLANGDTDVHFDIETNDVIGRLAKSILKICKNNKTLSVAAANIGQGNFDINIRPRSQSDILGNAIVKMKDDLQNYSQRMEQLVAVRTEELARSNEDLQQFAHVASHDLKEPLRKIGMFSNILIEEQSDKLPEKGRLYLRKIELAADRLSKMIEGVLAYSTVAVNEPSFELVDLNQIIAGVESDLELVIIQNDAQIIKSDLPPISGNPLQMHQVFYNLINNALKFSRAGVPTVIRLSSIVEQDPAGKMLHHIIVEDNGIGFNPAFNDKMFNVFFRLNNSDQYEGTGLGLALCRKIILPYNGTIYAEGKEGVGARFHILLPATKE